MQAEKTEILQNFSTRLKSAMSRRGVTLQQIADHLKVATSTVGAWTQAKNWPKVQLQPQLSAFLGVSTDFLIHGISVNITEPVEITAVHKTDLRRSLLVDDTAPSRTGFAVGESDPVQLREGFQPPAPTPTRQDCLKHLDEYLRRAEREPGGIGYAYRILMKDFPLDEFDGPKK